MRKYLLLLILLTGNLIYSQSTLVPCDDNINCASAQNISITQTSEAVCIQGCNVGMPQGPSNSNGGACENMTNATAWFTFNSGSHNNGYINFSSQDLTTPQYSIYKGCDNWLECNPTTIALEPNTNYFIAVSDDNAAEGDFTLCIALMDVNSPCVGQQTLEIISASEGSPLTGPFVPCEELTVRYSIDFTQTGSNWIHSIIPSIGNCFDYVQGSEPFPVVRPNGNAPWIWRQASTLHWKPTQNGDNLIGTNVNTGHLCVIGSADCIPFEGGGNCSNTGTPLPAGWVATSNSSDCNSNEPNLSWGDSKKNIHTAEFTIKVPCTACSDQSCNDYYVSVASFSDGHTGGNNNNACNGQTLISKKFTVNCCQPPEISVQNDEICSKGIFNSKIILSPANSTIEWTVPEIDGITGTFDGEGSKISQTIRNSTYDYITIPYSVVAVSPTGCKNDPVTLELEVYPDLITQIDDELINCLDSMMYIGVNPYGGSGGGYVLNWSTGDFHTNWIGLVVDKDTTITIEIEDDGGCTETDTFHITPITESVSMPVNTQLIGNTNLYIFNNSSFSVDQFPLAQSYEWTFDGVVMGEGSEVEFRIPYTTQGAHTLCVRASNSCDHTGLTLCWDVNVVTSKLNADCTGAEYICSKKARKILLPGLSGNVSDLSYDNVCNPNGYGEYNSHWMEFDIAKAGKLTFTITPTEEWRDMDFAVYRVVDSLECYTKVPVRCMWSGGGDCDGATGLRLDETDEYEYGGCSDTQNNFLAPLDCEVGEKYYLAIFGGDGLHSFDLEWCGNALMSCDTVACGPLSVDAVTSKSTVRIYPNPNTGIFNLEMPSATKGSIELYNINGKKLHQQIIQYNTKPQQINVENLLDGIYFVIVRNESGRIANTIKMVIAN